MRFFKPKYTVCEQCKVLFEPTTEKLGMYCPTCRKPIAELKRRQDFVIEWATENWQELEPQAIEAQKVKEEECNERLRRLWSRNYVSHG